jgi:hypothetical protein
LHSSFRDTPPFRRSKAAITASQLIDFPGQCGVFRWYQFFGPDQRW